MDAEDPLYILYTSGSTGKPKGILHTTGGYLTGVAATTKYIFDIKDSDVYWCTADVGWVTGHSYVVYGPLANGATVFLYEGAPDWPQRDRFWSLDREVRHHHHVHGPDGDPGLYEVGHGLARQARPVQPAPLRLGGRADQPGSLALVQRAHRAWPLPHRGYLVADRDRGDHDHAPAGPGRHQARQRVPPLPRHRRRSRGRAGQPAPARHGPDGHPGHHPALAVHAPNAVGRRRALQERLLEQVRRPGLLLPRRRRAARRRRRLLAAGPRGRHHAGRGPQRQHDGGRVRPWWTTPASPRPP